MSAPDTNVPTQARRHSAPIWGIGLAAVFGAAIGGLVAVTAISNGDAPEGAATQVDGRTGQEEPAN